MRRLRASSSPAGCAVISSSVYPSMFSRVTCRSTRALRQPQEATVAKRLSDRAWVKRRFPHAHAYQWGPREWVVYASDRGALQGIAMTGTCTSQKAAWVIARRDIPKLGLPSVRRAIQRRAAGHGSPNT